MLELAKLKSRNAVDINLEKLDINRILSNVVQRCKVIALAKEIVAIHNTNIQVESVLNQGSCFSVIFQLV